MENWPDKTTLFTRRTRPKGPLYKTALTRRVVQLYSSPTHGRARPAVSLPSLCQQRCWKSSPEVCSQFHRGPLRVLLWRLWWRAFGWFPLRGSFIGRVHNVHERHVLCQVQQVAMRMHRHLRALAGSEAQTRRAIRRQTSAASYAPWKQVYT